MFKVLSVNTQTAESFRCISVISSFFSVQHLDGLTETSIATILCNALNVSSQNFSRKFCVIFSHKSWKLHICVIAFYNSSLNVNFSCILNYSYCVRFSCIFYRLSYHKLKIFYELSSQKISPQPGNISQNTCTNFRLFYCFVNQVPTYSGKEFITSPDVSTATLRFLNALIFSDVN